MSKNECVEFLEELAGRRRQYLDGLDANQGAINLDIFEEFYPDQAHFIFELLQNAEDAGATEATFNLTKNGCGFDHNGRKFTKEDIDSITGINNSNKIEVPEKIGKFGIGFKSVFAYTSTPIIHSGDFKFKILRYVLPEPLAYGKTAGTQTCFDFPFNNPKMKPGDAYIEIEMGLNELTETTLLFLDNLTLIRWKIDGEVSGEVRRIAHADKHFEICKKIDGKIETNFRFLKFDRPVEGLATQRVAIAFALEFLPKIQSFDSDEPLAAQLKIVPTRGHVAVFFPAKKEISGLRFHLHAPFVPELSRASIKETPDNEPLFEQIAELTADSLSNIRDLGLLSADFLGVLPNHKDELSDCYSQIRSAVVQAMKTQKLTPTYTKSHAPARHLYQTKASLKDLLSKKDMKLLIGDDNNRLQWAVSATQKNNDVDRFLSQLEIEYWDIEHFVNLTKRADSEFVDWLADKPIYWHQQFYALLYRELLLKDRLYELKDVGIVRLDDGKYRSGNECFFQTETSDNDGILPRVDMAVYTSGKNKKQQQHAKNFLRRIGVREIGETEKIEGILKKKYTLDTEFPDKETHQKDLKRFVDLVKKEPGKSEFFKNFFIFYCKDNQWHRPCEVFLDEPFRETGLTAYFNALGEYSKCFALSENYLDYGISRESFVSFTKAVGVHMRLKVQRHPISSHPEYIKLRISFPSANETHTKTDQDWYIADLSTVLETPSKEIARLVRDTMNSAGSGVLNAWYSPNQKQPLKKLPSTLILTLQKHAWVPKNDGTFVRPAKVSRESLPGDFAFELDWPWINAIEFGKDAERKSEDYRRKQTMAKELGFSNKQALEDGLRFARLSPKQRQAYWTSIDSRSHTEPPERISTNPERRAKYIREDAAHAPERKTEMREHSTSVNRDAVKKEEAKPYLMRQYTRDGEMWCQICKRPLPFKLENGKGYFEAVEFLPELKRHHYQNYLALCPNHAAMFKHANGSSDSMREIFENLSENELQIKLARKNKSVYFTTQHKEDLKNVIEGDVPTRD